MNRTKIKNVTITHNTPCRGLSSMLRFFLVILLLWPFTICAENAVHADPDNVFTGFEYAGASAVKLGDCLFLKLLQTGGFIEVRDETHFNTKIAPTHNWRGYFFLYANIITRNSPEKITGLNIGYEHESAHPTMGIKRETNDPYIKIYDSQYRSIDLNSLLVRYNRKHLWEQNTVSLKLDYQFHFYSKNTPEIVDSSRAMSNGISLGIEYSRSVKEYLTVYVSVFDRYIFKGKKHDADYLYKGMDTVYTSYPIINEVNTISGKTGLLFDLKKLNRYFEIYFSTLYGNIFGFVDSREKQLRISGGICISN